MEKAIFPHAFTGFSILVMLTWRGCVKTAMRGCPLWKRRWPAISPWARQSSLKAPSLPSKPLQETSSLNGKAYAAAGQAVASLHTMAVLQAYQADLLKDLDKGSGLVT